MLPQLGHHNLVKVAIVERQLLGGTCLHKGCIPTKSLLKSAEVAHTVTQSSEYGIKLMIFPLISTKLCNGRRK